MPVSANRRSKVLFALVASMTLGAGLLLWLAPEPLRPLSPTALTALTPPSTMPAEHLRIDAAQWLAWERVVIHASRQPTGSLNELDRLHRDEFGGCAYHFVLNADGRIESSGRWKRQALAPRQADGSTVPGIHIVLIGQFDRQPPAPEQLKSLRLLVGQLTGQLNIPMSKVLLHSQLEAEPCPGPAFPTQWMRQ